MLHLNSSTRNVDGNINFYFRLFLAWMIGLAAFITFTDAMADEPGRGITAGYEVSFMKSLADHHMMALEETAICKRKAQTPQLLSLCRRNNSVQREEILALQRMLKNWYNINYTPQMKPQDQAMLNDLAARSGADFEIYFMRVFSRHHFIAVQMVAGCQVGAELKHKDLMRLCDGALNAQLNDIDEMRHLLCDKYKICDYQPFNGVAGRATST